MGLIISNKDDDGRASAKRAAKKQGGEPKMSFFKNLLKKIN